MIRSSLLLLAALVPQAGRRLPPLPSDFHLCAVARETADYVIGAVRNPEALDVASGAHSLHVFVSSGTLPRGETEFSWDEGRPPIQLGKPTGISYTYNKQALAILDASRRLLAISYENEEARGRLFSALATARAASRRFSEEELDWAWFASRSTGFRLPRVESSAPVDGIVAQPGHVELFLRFGEWQKLSMLQPLRWKPALDARDIEWLELAAHDVGGVQDEAVRTLLEHGASVPPALFLSENNRLWKRLAAGDEAAQHQLAAPLERAQRLLLWRDDKIHTPAEIAEHEIARFESIDALLAIAAHGPPEIRPLVAAFVRKGAKNSVFAWLALGGSAQELHALNGMGSLEIPPWELEDVGTLEALDLLLARVRECAERIPTHVSTELVSVDHLVRRLQPSAPKEVLERVAPILRGCLEHPGVPVFALRMSLLRAGDPQAMTEIARMSADELGGIPPELAELPGDEVVPILVRLLVRYLTGFEHDDTCQGPSGVAFLASQLHARSESDRARALALFDGAKLPPHASSSEVTFVRWALGELPEPRRLLELGRSRVAVACRLDLAAESPRYASILGELRANPRRNWWALAALHDQQSLPVFGAWLTDDDRMARTQGIGALEKMGSPAGAPYIHGALPALDPTLADWAFTVLGEIEAPDGLARLASLCAPTPATDWRRSAGNAFLVLLGRRP